MKKIILALLFCLIPITVLAADRVRVQVQFKKGIFQCKDGSEEVVDFSVGGGNTYEHTCADGEWTNKFIAYNGFISYTELEYEALKVEDLETTKTIKVDEWIYKKNNPPVYVEPTKEELEAELAYFNEEVTKLEIRIDEKDIIPIVIE